MPLITELNKLQEQSGYLREDELRDLSRELRVPLHAIQAVVSFYPHFRTTPPPKARVAVCRDMACHLAGGEDLCRRVTEVLEAEDVEVQPVSCLGRCDSAPAAAINDVPLSGRDVQAVITGARNPDRIETSYPQSQPRRWRFKAYDGETEHYSVIRRLRAGSAFDVIAEMKAAGLRGMGGAAFPVGMKTELVAKQPGPVKYVICNADESEPGTFKDRMILSDLPHLVIEGIMIAAHVVGAQKGFVFIRHEYGPERDIVARQIDTARQSGLLNQDFDIEIFSSPGGYILGEETALLECMENKRGEPRNKPPFPGEKGLHGRPTLINNVETLAAVPAILNRGVEWWKSAGTRGCHGYKFISVSGHVQNADVYQIPMGTTVRELIDTAGGMKEGKSLKAFAPGGASSNFLPADKVDTPIDFDHLADAGSMLGSGALFVVAEGTDMLDLATNVVRFFRNESCGKCVPCRMGSEKAVHMLEAILAQGGRREQVQLLEELADTMSQTSICGLGQVALNPVLSVFKRFPADWERYVK